MKGKIPATGGIILSTDESQWSLLASGLVEDISLKGIIQLEPCRKVEITMLIKKAYPPECIKTKSSADFRTNLNRDTSLGISRISVHLLNFLDSKKWILVGEIQVEGRDNVPIVLVHYSLIEMSFYAQKTIEETVNAFLPSFGGNIPSVN